MTTHSNLISFFLIPGSGLPDQVSELIIDNVTPFANPGPPGISM
jgi:hypothetical protein